MKSLALLWWSSLSILANDASFIGDGATVYATKDNRVRMVKEIVQITYDDTGKDQRPWRANCTFEFENLTSNTVSLTMGFPNWFTYGDNVGSRMAFQDFTTEIDGKTVKTSEKDIQKERLAAPWKARGKIASFDGAIVWPIELKPKARITVKNKFTFGGFSSNGPFDVFDHMPATYPKTLKEHTFWSVRKPSKSDIDFANALVKAVAYITTTGRTWNGPIGEADISIELPPVLRDNPHYAIPLPVGYHMSNERVSWKFVDYSPKEEIALYYLSHVLLPDGASEKYPTGFEYKEQAEAWVRFSSKSSIAPQIIDRLVAISPKPEVRGVLERARMRLVRQSKK